MVLTDFGADVIRIDRPQAASPVPGDRPHLLDRGRRSIAIDLKAPGGRELALALIDRADVVTEGYRPGVAERLGLGPDVCLERNPRLVYARMTGWGQTGPHAQRAGHDLGYLALSGVLGALGAPGTEPPPPLNLIGDFGGGGMFLVLGILLALMERAQSGRGQVVDAAILDGVGLLATTVADLRAGGIWRDERGANIMDGGAPFYRTYETSDGGYMAVAAVEPQFYAALLRGTGLAATDWPQYDRSRWPAQHRALEECFASRAREEWTATFAELDACVEPVLDWDEALAHPQARERETHVQAFGAVQPAPAPRLSRTPASVRGSAPKPGEHTAAILAELGMADDELDRLTREGAIARP